MSTYNGERYLKQQIDSIINQRGGFDISILVRDDGSSDNTTHILDEYKKNAQLDYYRGENLKPAKSFMDLLFKSKDCDYYAFCDQDDVWDKNKLCRSIKALRRFDKPVVYYSNAALIDSKGNLLNKNVYSHSPKTDVYTVVCSANILGCSMVINRKLRDYIIGHDIPRVVVMHDSFVARVCSVIGGRVLYDKKPQLYYRQHESNVIGTSVGLKQKIKQLTGDIFKKGSITLDDQMKEIKRLYGEDIRDEYRDFVDLVSDYRSSIRKRVYLCVSRKPKYYSLNMSIKYRCSFLLGNR